MSKLGITLLLLFTISLTAMGSRIIERDTLVFKYLYSKAEPHNSARIFITRFDGIIPRSGLKIVKVTLDNTSRDTLSLKNYVYQIKKGNSWKTIPCASEDLGWIIPPKSKGPNDFGLPSNYVFVPGLYRIHYVFSRNSISYDFDNIYVYFELKEHENLRLKKKH